MSEKSVAERLQVKNGRKLAVISAPKAVDAAIGEHHLRAESFDADVVLLFVRDRAALETEVPGLFPTLKPTAIFWVGYPKQSSRLASDLSRDGIRAAAPAYGLDTVSQIAVDEDWSALRLKQVL